ncbi:hypothetical protein [Streptomyces sp. NPDC051921]|uniref:hypothetical protein n=1 Tax=Streptomyces sp. NPDC051921 TaxID=3155806 RepID=UPI0034334D4D
MALYALDGQVWLPTRVLLFLGCAGGVVECCVQTWKLVRGQEGRKATSDHLVVAERGETPS